MLVLNISRHSTHASGQPGAALAIVSFLTTVRDLLAANAAKRKACLKTSKKSTPSGITHSFTYTGINNMTQNTMAYSQSGISPLKNRPHARPQHNKLIVKILEAVAVKEDHPMIQGRSDWSCHRNQKIDFRTLLYVLRRNEICPIKHTFRALYCDVT